MSREYVIPAMLALAAHGLLALVPVSVVHHASPALQRALPLQVSIIHRELPSAPSAETRATPSSVLEKNSDSEEPPAQYHSAPSMRPAAPPMTKTTVPTVRKKKDSSPAALARKPVAAPAPRPVPQPEKAIKRPMTESQLQDDFPETKGPAMAHQEEPSRATSHEGSAGQPLQVRQAALPPPSGQGKPSRERTLAIPRYDVNPPPSYPRIARMRGQEGTCLVNVEVRADGTPGEVTLARSSGYEVLDRAALEAVRSWRFVPGTEDGKPVAMRVKVPVTFRLK